MVAEHQSLSILLIDGDEKKAREYEKILGQSPYLPPVEKIYYVSNMEDALALLDQESFDLVIVDLFLPDSSGLDTFLLLQKTISELPIIILTTAGNEALAFDAISMGAEDYLLQNEMNLYTISRAIRNALERHPFKEILRAQTFEDELTGVYNRRGFFSLAEQQREIAQRENIGFYLFLIDLDHLKDINDTFGHKAGDKALMVTADCLKDTLRNADIVARIGGDEFAALLIGADEKEGEAMIQNIREAIQNFSADLPFNLSVSIGRAFYNPRSNPTLSDLLETADLELYQQKKISHRKSL